MDHQEGARKLEQQRALDIHKPAGALINHSYLERQQEVVAVNRNDLEDIISFDRMESSLAGLGLFLLSGALWLGIDKLADSSKPEVTPVVVFCACSVVFGALLVGIGYFMGRKKRNRISRIFQETKPIGRRYRSK
nr:phage holin family protein [uncultured Devosia sp.]